MQGHGVSVGAVSISPPAYLLFIGVELHGMEQNVVISREAYLTPETLLRRAGRIRFECERLQRAVSNHAITRFQDLD
jgi:hypothetical protein